MDVEAVVADVRAAAREPLGVRLFPIEHLREWLEPVQLFAGQLAPKTFGIVLRPLPHGLVLLE